MTTHHGFTRAEVMKSARDSAASWYSALRRHDALTERKANHEAIRADLDHAYRLHLATFCFLVNPAEQADCEHRWTTLPQATLEAVCVHCGTTDASQFDYVNGTGAWLVGLAP